ncbi:MAG: hypothetical protein KME31_18935 [Tolypothrix carrinoi HA7290-LM1]|nr:hypothetical protein [Tolypothrix carrinoi HA7290-LM1]
MPFPARYYHNSNLATGKPDEGMGRRGGVGEWGRGRGGDKGDKGEGGEILILNLKS